MAVFLAIFIMMTTFSVAIFMAVRVLMKKCSFDKRILIVIMHFLASGFLVLTDFLCGGSFELRLPFDMLTALFPMLVISSSVWDSKIALRLCQGISYSVWGLIVFYILCRFVFHKILTGNFIVMSGVILVIISLVYLSAIIMQVREIRQIMNRGNVWSYLCLIVDMTYLLFIVIYVMSLLMASCILVDYISVVSDVVSILIAFQMVALGLRVSFDSLFVILRKHERRIVESMKISQNDCHQDSYKVNEIYKDIYNRLVSLFENEKPYLNSELTINDIVKVTFTNKLYISRAINQFTGRNFCQFVNYYRVLHSIELFRQNPDLKVMEMATRSGFNSTVTFSMAFRLYMSECPSDWCRKEKFQQRRRKK